MCLGRYFPISHVKVLAYIKDVVEEWEPLGLALQLPYRVLREINADIAQIASKKEEMVMKWIESSGPACWWLLVKALEEIGFNVAAYNIRVEQGISIIILLSLKGGRKTEMVRTLVEMVIKLPIIPMCNSCYFHNGVSFTMKTGPGISLLPKNTFPLSLQI